MNTTTTQTTNGPGGNWIAFIFGAAFNVLANVKLIFMLDYILQAIIGGIICLAFKIIGDVLSPLWLKHRDKIRKMTKVKSIRFRKKKRNDQD